MLTLPRVATDTREWSGATHAVEIDMHASALLTIRRFTSTPRGFLCAFHVRRERLPDPHRPRRTEFREVRRSGSIESLPELPVALFVLRERRRRIDRTYRALEGRV